ncbi:MAG: ribokinase [Coriobacteriia bacterium]|nr:ribokinase [Coriobacteriia bacterium]
MKALCFGSMNIDKIYSVDHFVSEGETIPCETLNTAAGGKGLNQAVALSRAGVDTYMAGCIGPEDAILMDTLEANNVNTENVVVGDDFISGHAIIQIDKRGQNSILVFRGANLKVTEQQVIDTISKFSEGDYLLLQNEILMNKLIIDEAKEAGMIVVLNPSPVDKKIYELDFNKVDYLIMNELEKQQLDDHLNDYPELKIVLTLGDKGSVYMDMDNTIKQEAYSVDAVDTTGAGDTFTGYFIAGIMQGRSVKDSMDLASRASSIACTKLGAAKSIPELR